MTEDRKIVVTNLPPGADEELVRDCFGAFGLIETVTFAKKPRGLPRTAFIVFETNEIAQEAKAEMLGEKIDGYSIGVRLARSKPNGVPNLLVENLPDDVEEHEIDELFGRFGDIYSTDISKRNRKTIAHVQFCERNAVTQVLKRMHNGYQWKGRQIIVKECSGGSCNLVITNLSPKTTKVDLERRFQAYGEVISAIVTPTKRIGHCCMENIDDAMRAIYDLTGTTLHGSIISVWKDLKPEDREKHIREGKAVRVKGFGQASERDLLDHFSQYGNVLVIWLNNDRVSASVYFRQTISAIGCIAESAEVQLNTCQLNISFESKDIMTNPFDCIKALLLEEHDISDQAATTAIRGLSPVQIHNLIWNEERRMQWLSKHHCV